MEARLHGILVNVHAPLKRLVSLLVEGWDPEMHILGNLIPFPEEGQFLLFNRALDLARFEGRLAVLSFGRSVGWALIRKFWTYSL